MNTKFESVMLEDEYYMGMMLLYGYDGIIWV